MKSSVALLLKFTKKREYYDFQLLCPQKYFGFSYCWNAEFPSLYSFMPSAIWHWELLEGFLQLESLRSQLVLLQHSTLLLLFNLDIFFSQQAFRRNKTTQVAKNKMTFYFSEVCDHIVTERERKKGWNKG